MAEKPDTAVRTFRFEPLVWEKRKTVTPKGREFSLLVVRREFLLQETEFPDKIEEGASGLVGEGLDYFYDLVGDNFPYRLSDSFYLSIKRVEAAGAACGAYIEFNLDYLEKIVENPKDEETKKIMRSVAVHELLHNLTDEEDFPMLAEIIFDRENGMDARIESILRMYGKNELAPAHQKGMNKIGEMLGASSPEDIKDKIINSDTDQLKRIFISNLLSYCKEQIGEGL